ncbi:type II secretion system protein [Bacillus sp. BRMEA1]|uniref:PulJ/GspJ family protein n=1 Tax=Neobacillus endophyticus TaxID=2738405 RepID=UPI0015658F1B|nr:type II secretion system protein [Neobacillus endophyticus]NRD80940.1 type II secretion system protein [Neobacillus endophyticus]
MNRLNQKGLTLIELLVVVSISAILLSVAYSIFFTMTKSSNQNIIQSQLRDESVIISQQFDQAMLNIDEITNFGPLSGNGMFTSFNAIDKTIDNSMTEHDTTYSIMINNGDLFINNKKINSDNYSLQNTTFKYVNQALQVYFEVDDLKNNQKFKFFKLYNVKSGE